MTEKVKVTREQAEAIERIKTEQIKRFEEVKKNKTAYLLTDWEKPLFELESKHLQDALYIGYEVEPEVKVGDWVKANWIVEKPTIHKLKGIDRNTVEIDGEQNNTNPGISIISLATPEEIAEEKERRWWAKHGRDVWELKTGDILAGKRFRKIIEVECEYSEVNGDTVS